MTAREAVLVLRDHGPEASGERFEAVLAIDPPVIESGSSPSAALRRLVTANPEALERCLREGHREVEAFVSLGRWEAPPTGELLELACVVLRDPDRVSRTQLGPTIEVPELTPEVRELARCVLERWVEARGLRS